MSPDEARRALVRRLADGDAELAELALWIAAEADPTLIVADALARLDALAEGARSALAGCDTPASQLAALDEHLYRTHRFRGNRRDYYDPRNSYLHEVLERRTGIPITLAIVYLAVAARCGVAVAGVGFPGHFLLRSTADPRLFVDPFDGELLSRDDCLARFREAFGSDLDPDPRLLDAASDGEILARVLRNLKQIHLSRRDLPAALACCERVLLVRDERDEPHELRDRGLLQGQLECWDAAIADLDRFLQLAPHDESCDAVRAEIARLRAARPVLH